MKRKKKTYIIQENAKRLAVKKNEVAGVEKKQVGSQLEEKRIDIHVHVQRRGKEMKSRGLLGEHQRKRNGQQ